MRSGRSRAGHRKAQAADQLLVRKHLETFGEALGASGFLNPRKIKRVLNRYLAFLGKQDLATYAGDGRPVILFQHYGWDTFSLERWDAAKRTFDDDGTEAIAFGFEPAS